jgi:hypothetical protein
MEHEINELFKLSLLRRPRGRGGVAKKLLRSQALRLTMTLMQRTYFVPRNARYWPIA